MDTAFGGLFPMRWRFAWTGAPFLTCVHLGTGSAYDKKDAARIKDVKLWSDAFYKLVKQHPELGKFLADTQKLIIVIDGEIYRIQ